MYFKIIDINAQKYKDIGMIEVSAAFYLEDKDEGYDKYVKEHYVTVPVWPEGGYKGEMSEFGTPADKEDFDSWRNSLPTIQRFNPFCNHSMQFEPNVTPEEIVYCMQLAVEMSARNYLKNDLDCKVDGVVVNQDINYLSRRAYYEGIKQIPPSLQTVKMAEDIAKVLSADTKATYLKTINFDLVGM